MLSKIILSQLKDIREKIGVFDTVLNVDFLWHTLPEATEKVTEENRNQNFSNTKSFTKYVAQISMNPPFHYYCLVFWGIFDVFHDAISRYFQQWPQTLHPFVIIGKNLRSIGHQICPQVQVLSVRRQKIQC